MRCEWCGARVEAEWWGETVYGAESAMCTGHRDRICVKDEAGEFVCVTIKEKEAERREHGA